MILSMLPAASAFAQTAPTVTLTEVGHNTVAAQVSVGSPVVFTASSTVSNAEYQFWVESPNGTWTSTGAYSSNNSYTLTPSQSGDYLVTAYALSSSQLATGDYAAATNIGTDGNQQVDGVFVNSSVTLSTPSASVVAGHAFTVSATATNIYDAQYQFWYENPSGTWKQSGNYSSSNSFTFTPSQSGTYTFIAYAKSPLAINDPEGALYSNVVSGTVFPVINIGLTDSASTLPNNGKSPDTFTAAVTDQNGNPMSGVTVTFDSSNSGVISFASGAVSTTATTNASGVATATGTVGTLTGTVTALVTAQADLQSSSPVTVTSTQSPATQIGKTNVTPNTGTATTEVTGNGTFVASGSAFIGTAGASETVSAQIQDAQGNPVPGQQVVLTGNHVQSPLQETPTRENSIQEPGSTTFTPFSTANFGVDTSSASGMVSFTVENAANVQQGAMVPTNNTYFYVNSSTILPFNTYTVESVPSGTTVTEGTQLPSNLVSLGSMNIAWMPTKAPGTAIAVEPGIPFLSGTSGISPMPNSYVSGDSAARVVSQHGAWFTVQPFTDNTTSTSPIWFTPNSSGFVSPKETLTYTLTANNHGLISNVDGVNLSGEGNGWTYNPSTGLWSDTSAGGTNYASGTETVTITYATNTMLPYSFFGSSVTVYQVTVSNPNVSTPLVIAGNNPISESIAPSALVSGTSNVGANYPASYSGLAGAPPVINATWYSLDGGTPSKYADLNSVLYFKTTDTSAENDTVAVTATSTALGISSPVAANATMTVTGTALPAQTAIFNPAAVQNPTYYNGSTHTENIQVFDKYGNPVVGQSIAIDGATDTSVSGYLDGAKANNALWVTEVNGTPVNYNGTADAFPITSPSADLTGAGYQYPTSVNGVYSTNSGVAATQGALMVTTNATGMVSLTLQGGGAQFIDNGSTGPTQPVSKSNVYYVGAWQNGSYLGSETVGTGTAVSGIPAKITATNGVATSTPNAYAFTLDVTDTNGNPISGLGISHFGVTVGSTTYTGSTTLSNGHFTLTSGAAAGTYTLTVEDSAATTTTPATTGTVTVTAGGVSTGTTFTF